MFATTSVPRAVGALMLTLTLIGCGSGGGSPSADAGPDAAMDAGNPPGDAGADSGMDGGTDAGMDAGSLAANGESCTSDGECASANCLHLSFHGGQCGECNEDADCVSGGCSVHSPYEATGSTCGAGAAGDGCETTAACGAMLVCGTVYSELGLTDVKTCGVCDVDADCGSPSLHCIAVFDTETFEGQKFCLAANSLSLGDSCDLDGDGDTACASNFCAPVDVAGLFEIGACGQCRSDTDCGGDTCTDGTIDSMGTGALTGSTCP